MRFQIRISGWVTLQATSFEEAKEKAAAVIEPMAGEASIGEGSVFSHLTLKIDDEQKFHEGKIVMLVDSAGELSDEGPAIVLDEGYQGNGGYTVEILPRAREKGDPDGLREVGEHQMRPLEPAIEAWWNEHGWKMPPKPRGDDQ